MSVLRIALPATSERLGRRVHVALDEPDGWTFFDGAPDYFPGTECYDTHDRQAQRENLGAQRRWIDSLFARCADGPGIPPADRDHVVAEAMKAWRWDDRTVQMPGPNTQQILLSLAERTGRLPSELMRLPISDLLFNYRIFFDRDAKARKRRRGLRVVNGAMNDPNLPDEIPVEAVHG